MLHFRSHCWSILFRPLWAWSLTLSNWCISYSVILRLSLTILKPLLRLEHLLLLLLWWISHRCQSLHHLTLWHDLTITIIIITSHHQFVLQFAIFSSFRFLAPFTSSLLLDHLYVSSVCIDAVDLCGMSDHVWGVVVAIAELRHRAIDSTAVADREHGRVVLRRRGHRG